jgi:ADP-L-glycero-D-manno-heptose 6-epimerase
MNQSYLVTGAYGFIGSNFIKYLNTKGAGRIDVSDYLFDGRRHSSLDYALIHDFIHPDEIDVSNYHTIFHFGAISDTTRWDGDEIIKRNYIFTRNLIDKCELIGTKISYASSASVYGNDEHTKPLNMYAYSKWLTDRYVLMHLHRTNRSSVTQGFRYFNVYSTDDSEEYKGDQASPYYKFKQQALETGVIKIFEGSENFKRDFIHVKDVCAIQWAMACKPPGIYDLGTGRQKSFLEVAEDVAARYNARIEYIPFPEHLRKRYQTSTLADMSYLQQLQLNHEFV